MADDETVPVDLDGIVEHLRQRVAERRSRGEYPEGLVESLDEQFQHLVAQREVPDWPDDEVEAAFSQLESAGQFGSERIELGGGSAARRKIHELAGRLVTRQVQGILEQAQAFSESVRSALALHWRALRTLDARQSLLEQRLESALDKLARYERGDGPPGITAKVLQHELGELRSWRRAVSCLPALPIEAVDELLGPREEVMRSLAPLIDHFDLGPVLDIGLGRGEAVELLAGRGLDATGIGLDGDLVRRARDAGLPVRAGDAAAALMEWDDASLGGVFVAQVVERLSPQQLVDVVAESARVLRPTGLLVVEACNPRSLYALANDLFRDPMRLRPVDPAYLDLLCRSAGFTHSVIEWRSPVPEQEPEQGESGDRDPADRLSSAWRAYALLARA